MFINNNGKITVISDEVDTNKELHLGTYYICYNPTEGFYLSKTGNITVNTKVYGKETAERTNRIINTFTDRKHNTGVLLSGIKGSGKSLQMKHIIETLRTQYNTSSLIINSEIPIEKLSLFLNEIKTPVAIVIDEFEKIFDDHSKQEGFLSILDGLSTYKKLYIFTCNDITDISDFMLGRPSRIYYRYDYTAVNEEAVKEYCNSNVLNKKHTEEILNICSFMGSSFNFDILQILVEEANRYNENPYSLLDVLNIKDNDANRKTARNFSYIVYCKENNTRIPITSRLTRWLDLEHLYDGDVLKICAEIPASDKTRINKLKQKYKNTLSIVIDDYANEDKVINMSIFFTIENIVGKKDKTLYIRIEDLEIELTEVKPKDVWNFLLR